MVACLLLQMLCTAKMGSSGARNVLRVVGGCAGAAMAVGVACAGTGMRSAVDLLAPLLTDAVDYVRQGALISTALILMQQPEAKVRLLRLIPSPPASPSHLEV